MDEAYERRCRDKDTMKSDSDLQKSVMHEFAWDTRLDATAIGVSAHHGIVTLFGVVGSWAEKHAAEVAAHRVAGVLDVANDLDIKLSWSTKRSDADIAEAVRRALEWDVFIPQRQIRSTVSDGGHVALSGTVGTLAQRDDAERAVRNLEGVRLVTNQLAIEVPKIAASELRIGAGR
jgi:osmotically-inducible protein OsmY